jgi:hypothetical protein
MRVMVIVKATKEAEAADNPFDVEGAAEMFEAMGKYNEELVKAGIMLAGDGLKPGRRASRRSARTRHHPSVSRCRRPTDSLESADVEFSSPRSTYWWSPLTGSQPCPYKEAICASW